MYGQPDTFDYFQCTDCECLQIESIPPDLQRFYQGGYYSFQPTATPQPFVAWLIRARDRYAVQGRGLLGRLLHAFMPRLDIRFLTRVATVPETRILDIGCGSGKLLRTLYSIGYRQLTGIDPFIAADIELGPGARIKKSTIEAFDEPQDLIMFNHSLEHVPDQERTLRRAAELLAPNGVITVSIPVVSSQAWRTYGADWVQLDAPRHLYLHSTRSINLVAGRAGLQVVDVFQDSNAFQFWGSEQCRRGIALTAPNSYLVNPAESIFSRQDIARFRREAKRVNAYGCGDQATFILRPVR